MARVKKISGSCMIDVTRSKGRVTMKCRNLRRAPTAQEIIDSVKHKIIFR
jgi:hypothetical protein